MAFPRFQACIVLFVCIFLMGCESQGECIKTGTCTCTFNDQYGTKIDFGTIGNRDGTPKFDFGNYGLEGTFTYAFNPCFAFSAGSCKDVVGCQKDTNAEASYFDIGNPEPVSWTTDSDGTILVSYSATQGSEERTSAVQYTCEKTALKEPTLVIQSEAPTRTYNMEVKTCAACSPAVSGCSSSSGGLTGGGIVCIIFTVVVFVYIVGGILFQVFVRGATGTEVFPNHNFWWKFPGLVKDGFLFMLTPCRRGGYSEWRNKSMQIGCAYRSLIARIL
eukprot:XP_003729391.1 PREDICTED: cation-dependent mannose-6-phosphate receptor isoform X1 [Strongylocentrotus purpuratus]